MTYTPHLDESYAKIASEHRVLNLKALFKIQIPEETQEIVREIVTSYRAHHASPISNGEDSSLCSKRSGELVDSLPSSFSGKIYEVGSEAIGRIAKRLGVVFPRAKKRDFDFLILTDSLDSFTQSTFSSFILNTKLSNETMKVYYRDTRSNPGAKSCDLIVKSCSLEEHAKTVDITVCSFAILLNGEPEEVGSVFDPLGLAYPDLLSKSISIIGDPNVRFKESPVSLLRTIKYLARVDEVKDKKLISALRKFNPENCLQDDHFSVVLSQLLESPESHQIVSQMLKYRLVSKLALHQNITPKDNCQQIAKKMLAALYLRNYEQKITRYEPKKEALLIDDSTLPSEQRAYSQAYNAYTRAAYKHHLSEKYLAKLRQKESAAIAQLHDVDEAVHSNEQQITKLKEALKQAVSRLHQLEALKAEFVKKTEQYQDIQKRFELLQEAHDAVALDEDNDTDPEINQIKRHNNVLLRLEEKKLRDIEHECQAIQKENQIKAQALLHLRQQYDNDVIHQEARLKRVEAKTKRIETLLLEKKAQRDRIRKESSPKKAAADQLIDEVAVTDSSVKIQVVDDPVAADLRYCSLEQLNDLFYKIDARIFQCAIAYKLGVVAQQKGEYVKAAYYYLRILAKEPNHQQARARFQEIQLCLTDIDWSQKSAQYWHKKASEMSKDRQDEALLYYTLAINCDPAYINSYIGRLNQFYKIDAVLHFTEDHQALFTLIFTEKMKLDEKLLNLSPTEQAERDKLNKKIKELADLLPYMSSKLQHLARRNTPTIPPAPNASPNEKINKLWNLTHVAALLQPDKKTYDKQNAIAYERIILFEQNKTIEYAYAHYRISLCMPDDEKLALEHYIEASFVLPSIALMETGQLPDIDAYLKEKHIRITLQTIEHYKEQQCYFLALHCLDLMIKKNPNMTEAYWEKINLSAKIHREDLIDEKQLDQLISIYDQKIASSKSLESFRLLIELYLIKGDYSLAREVYMKIPERKRLSNPKELFSTRFNLLLSPETISEIRNVNKRCFGAFFADARYMSDPVKNFTVYRMLAKIARDEGQYMLAFSMLNQALSIEGIEALGYAYSQVEKEFEYLSTFVCEAVSKVEGIELGKILRSPKAPISFKPSQSAQSPKSSTPASRLGLDA